jgi:tetratricopeptide (TPR) repeat protein
VVSPQRVAELRSAAKDDAAFFKAASEGGITHLVTGEILTGPTGFTVATRLTDTRAGTDLGSNRANGASESDIVGAANQVATSVRRGLRIPLTEGVDTYNADFATKNTDAYEIYVKGLAAVSAYKYDEAKRLFTEALAKAPDFTMARFRLANVYASTSETEQATEQIRLAVTEASRLPDREARYIRALDAYIGRNYDEAAKQYKELIERYPYDIEPRQFLAQIHLSRKEWQEAIGQAKAMAQIEPQGHSTYAVAGSAYLGLKDYNQAITEFRKYADLEPGSANAHHLLADAYRAQGVLDLAAGEYRKALDADPAFHFSTVSLAEVEVQRGQPGEAERLLVPLVPDTAVSPWFRADAAVDLAAVFRAQGRFRDSIRVLGQAEAPIRAEKIQEALALATQALGHMELGELKRAEQLAREAVAKSPGVPTRYLFALAQIQLAQGKVADARATATEILKGAAPASDPDRTEDKAAAYLNGLAWLKEGKLQQAQQELSRAVALSGYEYAVYRLGLARAYLATRAFAEALAGVKQAMAPGEPASPRLDLDLDRVRAGLLEAQINLALGRRAEASSAARRFLQAWDRADPGLPDVAEARKLAAIRP